MNVYAIVNLDNDSTFLEIEKIIVRYKDVEKYIETKYPNAKQIDDTGHIYRLVDGMLLYIDRVEELS